MDQIERTLSDLSPYLVLFCARAVKLVIATLSYTLSFSVLRM